MPCAQPVLDAGDAQDENLGAAGGISVIGNWTKQAGKTSRMRGRSAPHFFRNLIARRLTGPEAARSAHPRSRQLMLPRNSAVQSVGFKRIRAATSLHWRRLRELL
jgi:hypothetical protein